MKLAIHIVAAIAALGAFGASVEKARYGALTRTNEVVTAVDLSGLATEEYVQGEISAAGAVTPEIVSNIVHDAAHATGNYATVSNRAMSAVQPSALEPYCTIAAARQMTNAVKAATLAEAGTRFLPAYDGGGGWNVDHGVAFWGGMETESLAIHRWANMVGDIDLEPQTLPDYLDSREAPLKESLSNVSNTAAVAASTSSRVYQYMTANTNAWFEGTNYESVAGIPCTMQLYEIREGQKRGVWDQREYTQYHYRTVVSNELNAIRAENRATSNAMPSKAWSEYASGTGGQMPTNAAMTWISTPTTVFSGGYEWQRVVGTEGECWVLVNNGMVAEYGSPEASTNGASLTIKDLDGNEIMAVRKTSSYEAGAIANQCSVSGGSFIVKYASISASHPTAYVATSLDSTFVAEDEAGCPATVAWSGSSGNWTATVTPPANTPLLFVRAKFMVEGSTAVEYSAPVSLTQLVIGGVRYDVGTATISGHTVLTLTPSN